MSTMELRAPLEYLTLSGVRYPVSQLSEDDLKALWGCYCIWAGRCPATETQKGEAIAAIAYRLLRIATPTLPLQAVLNEAPGEWMVEAYHELKRQLLLMRPVSGNA